MFNGNILRGLFEHERLQPAIIKISQGNIHNLPQFETSQKYRCNGINETSLMIYC